MPLTFALSVAGAILAFAIPGLSDLLLIAGPMALAAAILWLRRPRAIAPSRTVPTEKTLVIDGSNVMFWRGNHPKLDTVTELLDLLHASGYHTGIIFDASAGHVLFGRYLDDRHFADLLNLPETHCFVVPKGTVADEYILRAARDQGARVATNDRYRDCVDDFPEVSKPGQLIRGRYEKGALKLHRLAPRR
ncbi:hypothetical protein RXV86_15650 [Alisedimentitalea sp. MJ-SS2]|uniref:NYN domain-containing protein n=1 Tax=Aliisedimentitalea sp. MJ-SS2 TaxID=3049795 RepID=UPI00290EDBD6|nr:hypothetical protein [Alisedimentitalea sp. MJ-SS2]MDU8928827.1 hypothetical protein [Alisedimentitalea sp. MJ-SS2]